MMVHVVKETDAGIIVRGAKYETASGYADQAFLKPTVGAWTNEKLSDYAVGGIVRMGAPGVKHIARSGFAGRASAADYPLANKFDEVDFLMVLDNVLIPWEDVFFYRHTTAAQYIRGTLHRYSAFPYTLRVLYVADMMIGAAMWNAKQTGLDKLQAVREKLADLVCYREGINAHLTASIAHGAEEPGRPADAAPVDALCRPRLRLLEPAADDAHRARTVRRPDLRHAERGRVHGAGLGQLARKVLQPQRQLAGRGSPQAARLRARPAEFRLCRPSADLRPVRAGAALQSSRRGLQRVRFLRPARLRAGRPPISRTASMGTRHDMRDLADRVSRAMRRTASGVAVLTTDGAARPGGRDGLDALLAVDGAAVGDRLRASRQPRARRHCWPTACSPPMRSPTIRSACAVLRRADPGAARGSLRRRRLAHAANRRAGARRRACKLRLPCRLRASISARIAS